jgi:hypothetical protein
MKMSHRAVVSLLLAGFLAACGGQETRWAGTISDSAGVTIVSNTETGVWAAGEEWRSTSSARSVS